MTKEELAEQLNGRQYPFEMTKAEQDLAKESGLLVVFGQSDDLVELRGIVDDERGANNGAVIKLDRESLQVLDEVDPGDIDVLQRYDAHAYVNNRLALAFDIHAEWCETDEYCWTYTVGVPVASFDILEDEGEVLPRYRDRSEGHPWLT